MRALIVGAGCCGASAARRLAEYGWQVTVIARRGHIGGNAFDRREAHGILYHVYGPHAFFTDQERVWSFLFPFAHWTPFRCGLRVWIEGDSLPMPFQPETLRRLIPEEGDAVLSALPGQGVGLVVNPGCDLDSSRRAIGIAERDPPCGRRSPTGTGSPSWSC